MRKESIRHVRSIHFSLLMVSTLLLLTMLSVNKAEIRTAIEDAQGILKLQRLISEDSSLLKRLAQERFNEIKSLSPAVEPEGDQYYELLFETEGKPHKINLLARYPELLIKDRKSYYGESEPKYIYWNLDRGETVTISVPPTLGAFKEFWNFYNKERFIYYFPRERTATDNHHFSIRTYQFSSEDPDKAEYIELHPFYDDPIRRRISLIDFPRSVIELPSLFKTKLYSGKYDGSFELLLRPLQDIDINNKYTTHEYNIDQRTLFLILRKNDNWQVIKNLTENEIDLWKLALRKKYPWSRPTDLEWQRASFQGQLSGDILIEITHRVEPVKINYQQYFSLAIGRGWVSGDFSSTFSEIDNIAGKNLDSLSIEKLINILKSELKRSGDSIQILGIKLQSETISIWGMIALIGLQLYFILHFRVLFSIGLTLDDEKFPWIGLFTDQSSRYIFIATASLLPASVAVYNLNSAGVFKFIVLACVLVLSIYTYWTILKFQRIKFERSDNTEQDTAADS